ncbi:MAG: DUF4830 domain-containing protein [Eubacteriales bacterium]|nr:DUF4830 domain-containing protein [Eubacteriales bacterium]
MAKLVRNLRRRKLLAVVVLAAVLLVAFILIRSCSRKGPDLRSLEGRQAFLSEQGWEIDLATEEHKTVRIPTSLDGIIADYNEIQLKQGCDLSRHLGQTCEQYSYTVTNYPDKEQTVLVTLYVQSGKMIAGDVHSTALNGFMQGIKP